MLGNRPTVHCLYSAILDYAGGLGLVVQPGAVVMCGLLVVATCSLWRLVEAVPGWCGSVPRSELCRESIVWHEGREARPGSASQDGAGAAGLSCRAGPARGRGDADHGAEEQQVSQGWLVEQTAWSTELSPGGLAYFLQRWFNATLRPAFPPASGRWASMEQWTGMPT